MEIYSPTLFIEINNSEYIFAVGDANEQENFNLIYKFITPIQGIENYRIVDFDLAFNTIKKQIYIFQKRVKILLRVHF